MFTYLFFLLSLMLTSSGSTPYSQCYSKDSDCPPCPGTRPLSFTSLIFLSLNPTIVENVKAAQKIMVQRDSNDIIRLEDLDLLHTSVQYFCCHTMGEKEMILEILKNMTWEPWTIDYSSVWCNLDHNNSTVYIQDIPGPKDQEKLMFWVRERESTIRKAGIPINNPRVQYFHNTMIRVNHEYPTDGVLSDLANLVPFGSHLFDSFILDGRIFFYNGVVLEKE